MIFDIYYAGDESDKPLYKYPFIGRKGQDRYEIFEDIKNTYTRKKV